MDRSEPLVDPGDQLAKRRLKAAPAALHAKDATHRHNPMTEAAH